MARFLYHQLRTDIKDLDDYMLLTQVGYFGHHVEKAIKHQNKGARGLDKRNRLFELTKELEKRDLREEETLKWATHIIEEFDSYQSIYIERISSDLEIEKREDILDFMKKRTSVRFWQNKTVDKEVISKIIDTAFICSALSCNRQTLRVICVNNKDSFEGDSNNNSLQKKAPHLLYIANDDRFFTDKYETSLDVGSFCSSLMLAASALGVSGCWMYEGKFHDDDELRKKFGLSKHHYFYSVMALGYPLDSQEKPPRLNVNKVLDFYDL